MITEHSKTKNGSLKDFQMSENQMAKEIAIVFEDTYSLESNKRLGLKKRTWLAEFFIYHMKNRKQDRNLLKTNKRTCLFIRDLTVLVPTK